MSLPIVVYLDTQDYSRFGDVLRGKSDARTESLFRTLEMRKQAGDVIFAVSMPILIELLQYNSNFRETTLRKAEAVERLCGAYALPYLTRLIAAEIAMASQRLGLVTTSVAVTVLSDNRYWYPNIEGTFDDLRAMMKQNWDTEIAALGSRVLRRRAARELRRFDFVKAVREAAPEIAAKYGLPYEAIAQTLVPLLRGAITSAEASRRLFAYIAEPVSFVKNYFEGMEAGGTLPYWLRDFGQNLHNIFEDARNEVRPYLEMGHPVEAIKLAFAEPASRLGRRVVSLARDDAAEFGVGAALMERFSTEPLLAEEIPTNKIIISMVLSYIVQILSLQSQGEPKIESSFGGDLFHALYLPHVDLWRGDRRFAALLKSALPHYANRVVPLLTDLPSEIEAWCAKAGR